MANFSHCDKFDDEREHAGFLLGWATGGLGFGVLGDRIGRARTMLWTILIYSICTGLSAFSVGFWDFAFYRFLTGLGVGGVAVHAAARICGIAQPGEILVSSTVRDLAAGAGFAFADRGVHELRGVPEARQLYAVR